MIAAADFLTMSLVSSAMVGVATTLLVMWLGPTWDSYSRAYLADLAPRLDALGLAESGKEGLFRWWGIALFFVAFGVGIIGAMPPVAIGLTYLVFVAPKMILDNMISSRRKKLRDQMVRASASLANSARAGLSLPQGLEVVAADTPQPLQGEFKSIVHNYRGGMPLREALRRVERKLDIEAFTIFTSAILVCLDRGGDIMFALDRISTGLQDMQRLERKLEADSASGRQMATVLAVFPLFFLVMFAVLDPLSTSFLFETLPGQLVLLIVGATVYLAVRWCMRILTMDF